MFLISRVDKDSFTGNIDFSTRRIHPEDAVIVTQKTQELMNGTSERGLLEYRILRGDSSIGYLKTHAVVQRDAQNQAERVIGMVQDVTHEKLAENALRESYDRLSIANIELENALQVKDEFLASMSHELRTPLTGILGLSEALQLNTYGQLTEKQMRTLKNIEDSGKHLLSLINDILDLSKIESGKLEIQTASCSLADICQASLQLTKGMANQKRQIINYSAPAAPIILDVDMRRIKQVIVNLLSNAIKFTPETGELGLNIEADKLERQVRIIVWDKGIGIKPENLPKLFKPFTQIDSSLAREYSGTGLGLSLVKRLVELHDGTVTVVSVFGEGSRFIVTLPWTTQASVPLSQDMPISQTETTTENASAQLILITDDNRLLLDMLADFLEAQKYRTAKVYSGSEFLEKVAEIRPDLILMDIQMPGMDGLEVIRNLRKHQEPFIASIPVIAVTALAMAGDRERCLAAGANEYVSKPVVLKELKQSIHTLLGKDVE
ncbi:MAG: response regulator, partial [Chloroflexi bacterium]|nr:response regulator [Chloroflexota bacterium]